MDPNRNRGARAVITGGTQGLGLAIARRLAEEGAEAIALVGRDRTRGEAAAAEIAALGPRAMFFAANLADAADARRIVGRAIDAFGSVNALVNSAAITTRGSLVDTSLELFEEHMAVNLRAPFLTMQALVRHLLATGKPGSIVNILSMSAACGQPFLTPYSTSKGGLATLTKNVANAYRRNLIRCNGINAGWMDTPGEDAIQKSFHGAGADWLRKAEAAQPMGQLVKPWQLASLVAYMISPESGVMTGSLVDYDQNVSGAYGD